MLFSVVLFKTSFELTTIFLMTVLLISKTHFNASQHELSLFYMDSMSMNMVHLSIMLTCLCLIIYSNTNNEKKVFLCLMSGSIVSFFFFSSNLLILFISFEVSLIPLLLLILGWGKQPERLMAGKFMMFYTIMSSFPLLCSIVFFEELWCLFSMLNSLMFISQDWMSMKWYLKLVVESSFLLSFCTKVPLFFLHSWLPKAHVEAPLEGSIILAGVMLKVGIFGIFRMFTLFPFSTISSFLLMVIFSISLMGSLISSVMAVSSDDLKLSVAFSSVSHMNFLLCSMISLKEMSICFSNFTMISHGMISPMLFFFVTLIYEMSNSRSLVLVKGRMSKVPSVLFFSFVFFSLSVSIPPSISFTSELISMACVWSFSLECFPIVCLFVFTNSFFCLMSYGIMNHSSHEKNFKSSQMEIQFNIFGLVFSIIMLISFFTPECMCS